MKKKRGMFTLEESATISARVPKWIKELIRKYVEADTHISESDFVRQAVLERIKRLFPEDVDEHIKTRLEELMVDEVNAETIEV